MASLPKVMPPELEYQVRQAAKAGVRARDLMIPPNKMIYATDVIQDSVFAPWHEDLRKIVDTLLEGPFYITRAYKDTMHFPAESVWMFRFEFSVSLRRGFETLHIAHPIHRGTFDMAKDPWIIHKKIAYDIEDRLLRTIHQMAGGH